MNASGFWNEYEDLCRRYYQGTLTPRDWASWREARLRAVLERVTRQSAFYRRHLAGCDIGSVSPQSLRSLPFTTKADLQQAGYDVLCGRAADALVFYETTGTTGVATPCPRDARDIASSNAHVEQSWRRTFGHYFGERTPTIALMGPSELYAFGDTFGDVAARLGACHAKLWPSSPRVGFRTALRLMRELAADVVVCSPSLILSLAREARAHGYALGDFPVSLFLVLGEICTPQFAANAMSLWGASVLPTLYGSQEALAIATGCAAGKLHLSGPNYLAEVVHPGTGASLGGYGQGELCLTMLIDGIKPLIRYRTGDLVTVSRTRCACGAPGDLVEVAGRAADLVELGGREVLPTELEAAVLEGVTNCLGYQVVISSGAAGEDSVMVRLQIMPAPGQQLEAVCRGARERLTDRFAVSAHCSAVPDLDSVTGSGAQTSWKTARVQDLREPSAACPAR